jgi:hypothetical protein
MKRRLRGNKYVAIEISTSYKGVLFSATDISVKTWISTETVSVEEAVSTEEAVS